MAFKLIVSTESGIDRSGGTAIATQMVDDSDLPLHRADGQLMPLSEIIEAAVDHALVVCGNPSDAALALGVGRSTIYRYMKALGWTPEGAVSFTPGMCVKARSPSAKRVALVERTAA